MVELYFGDPELRARMLIGAALKAAARGKTVLFVSFKRDFSDCAGLFEPFDQLTLLGPQNNSQREYFDGAVRMAITFKYNMLILDGIVDEVAGGDIPAAQVQEFLSDAPDSIEIICGGHSSDERLSRFADEVVELSIVSQK